MDLLLEFAISALESWKQYLCASFIIKWHGDDVTIVSLYNDLYAGEKAVQKNETIQAWTDNCEQINNECNDKTQLLKTRKKNYIYRCKQ